MVPENHGQYGIPYFAELWILKLKFCKIRAPPELFFTEYWPLQLKYIILFFHVLLESNNHNLIGAVLILKCMLKRVPIPQWFKLLLRAVTKATYRRSSGEPVQPNLVFSLVSLLQPDSLHTSGRYISQDSTHVRTVHDFSVLYSYCYRPDQRDTYPWL